MNIELVPQQQQNQKFHGTDGHSRSQHGRIWQHIKGKQNDTLLMMKQKISLLFLSNRSTKKLYWTSNKKTSIQP